VFCSESDSSTDASCCFVCVLRWVSSTDTSCLLCVLQWVQHFHKRFLLFRLCFAVSQKVPQTFLVVSFVFCSESDSYTDTSCCFVCVLKRVSSTVTSCFVCVLQWVRKFHRHFLLSRLCSAVSQIVTQTLLVVLFLFWSESVPQTLLVSFVFFSVSDSSTDTSCLVCVLQWVR